MRVLQFILYKYGSGHETVAVLLLPIIVISY